MSYRETKDDEQLCLLVFKKDKCYKNLGGKWLKLSDNALKYFHHESVHIVD
jgi:hypothetical protein